MTAPTAEKAVPGPFQLENYRSIFEAIPSPYMVLDTELRYVAANEAYVQVTGRTLDELLGNRLFDLFPNEGKAGDDLRKSFQRVIETGKTDTLAYIHYAIPAPDGSGFEDRYWTAEHFPIFNESGYVEYIVQNTVDVTELHSLRRSTFLPFRPTARLETTLIRRVQEAEEAHKALLEENNDFRRLFEHAPGMVAVLTGPEHVFTFVNDSYTRFVGRKVAGLPVRSALPEIEGQGFFEMLDRVYSTAEPISGQSARVVLRDETTGRDVEAFLDFSYHPTFRSDGSVNGIFVQGLDRTESVRAEKARELLLRELNHRVKNLFTVAMSMVNMTARNAQSPNEMAEILTGRLSALSHAHSLVMSEEGDGAAEGHIPFAELVRKIIAPHLAESSERLTIDGPDIELGSKAATSLALVMHELATNAAKYGALSSQSGRVAVIWQADGDDIVLEWKETGGPTISGAPEPSGFGSHLSRMSIEGQLGGKLSFDWPSQGVCVRIEFPRENAKR